MARRRIAVLLSGALVVGLGVVAFFQATPAWSYAARVFVPVACALAAVVGVLKGRQAPFAIGFAVCSAVLMTTVFPLGDPWCFSDLTDRMTDDAYAQTLAEPDQEWYYGRVGSQAEIVGTAMMVGASVVVGLVALYIVPPVVDRLARRFSVQRLMIAVVVVAAGLSLGREQYRNHQADLYRYEETGRSRRIAWKAVYYARIVHEGGIELTDYSPGEAYPPSSRLDEFPRLALRDGKINERLATVLARCDVRDMTLLDTEITDEARPILLAAFDVVKDDRQERSWFYHRKSTEGAQSPGPADIFYLRHGNVTLPITRF
ncbi:MAG: hypothetical protein U0836_00475 [Pirellulales bacterium]